MKRLSKKTRWWLKRAYDRRIRIQAKELVTRCRKKCAQQTRPRRIDLPKRIIAPAIFSIESNHTRKPLLNFLGELRKSFDSGDIKAITIDFAQTDKFVSSATLLFYAELCRLIERDRGRIRVRCKPPRNERARQVLHQIGVFEICGQAIERRRSFHADVVHWRAARGRLVDNSICAPAIEEFEERLEAPLVHGLLRGLGEAMTNAIHHAYLDTRDDGLEYNPPHKEWWMFSQARQGYLTVVFCDLGIGIPKTLPLKRPGLFQKILAMGRAESDSACIEDAIEDSRTRTKLPGRGKGLGNMVNVVSELKGGLVMIFSNRGFYYSKQEFPPKILDLDDSILGTLIYWRVPLAGERRHAS